MQDDPIWTDLSRKIDSYSPFLDIDNKKYKELLKQHFSKNRGINELKTKNLHRKSLKILRIYT